MMVKKGLRVHRDLHRPQPHFAHPIICQFDVSVVVQEDVVQLQVAVDDSLLMQEVQSDADFSSIKPEEERSSLQPEEPVRNLEPGQELRLVPRSYLACSSGSLRCRCM